MRACCTSLVILAACSFEGAPIDTDDGNDIDASSAQKCVAPTSSKTLTSLRVDSGPGLNGTLAGDWPQTEEQTVDLGSAPWRVIEEGITYDEPASFSVRSMHTATEIYFGVSVDDSVRVEVGEDSVDPELEDVIIIMIDAAGDRSGPFGPDDHFIAIDVNENTIDFGSSPATVRVGVNRDSDAWRAEIGISKAELGFGVATEMIGFNIGIVDHANLGGAERDAVGVWDFPNPTSCESACAPETRAPWCDTTMLGALTLAP